ncbi:MAG: DUF4363 family protein [Clostridiaceae bacterium]|nr:DUF4363 family protein [Clostridiaceae bacterium]
MRYVWSALGCLLLIIVLSLVNMGVMTNRLGAVDEELAAAYETCDAARLEKARDLWEENDAYLCATVPHKSMDAVTMAFTRAEAFLAENRLADARAEMNVAREGVRCLIRTERLAPGNIL